MREHSPFDIKNYNPWQFPDNPIDYKALITRPQGLGTLPKDKLGAKIAIIGAGCSGLSAAHELMQAGLHPVIYESAQTPQGTPRIGGRAYTYRFPGDPKAFAELGAMRIPEIFKITTYYMDLLDMDHSQPFPDPLLVPTILYFNGKKHLIPLGGPLPQEINKAIESWEKFILPLVSPMAHVWEDADLRAQIWQEYVDKYKDKSFYNILREAGLSRQDIQLFGSMGLGTGGFDSLYQVCFLEMLRLIICKWEQDQRHIKGGIDRLPKGLWGKKRHCAFWGQQNLAQLNNNSPMPGVKEIFTPQNPEDMVTITDLDGNKANYHSVIISCSPRALELDIKVNRETFSDAIWTAIRNLHVINSGKVFVRTKTTFWKHMQPQETLHCTITDEPTRGTYLFEFDDTPSGVICLSYTWEDSAAKFNALSHEERLETSLRTLEKIYGKDIISDQVEESISFYWEETKGFNGAFKLTYPGQYHMQKELIMQPFSPNPTAHNGVFLAGDAISWAGGWIEGAMHAGLNAAMAVIQRLGGNTE